VNEVMAEFDKEAANLTVVRYECSYCHGHRDCNNAIWFSSVSYSGVVVARVYVVLITGKHFRAVMTCLPSGSRCSSD
jgi:hypothetical protein